MNGAPAPAVSETFRMGLREARAALTRGGLLARVNVQRVDEVRSILLTCDPERVAGMLHDIAGPLNMSADPKEMQSQKTHQQERVASFALLAILTDMKQTKPIQSDNVDSIVDAICHWVDHGHIGSGVHPDESEGGRISNFLDQQASPFTNMALSRLAIVIRFSAALGAVQTLLQVPDGVLPRRAANDSGEVRQAEAAA